MQVWLMPAIKEWVDNGFDATQNSLCNTYYKKTLQVLYSLLLSGNFPRMNENESVKRLSVAQKNVSLSHAKQMIINIGHNKISGLHFSPTGKKITGCGYTASQPLIQLKRVP